MQGHRMLATLACFVLLAAPLLTTPQVGLTVVAAVVAALALTTLSQRFSLRLGSSPAATRARHFPKVVPPWLVREPARIPARPRAPGRG